MPHHLPHLELQPPLASVAGNLPSPSIHRQLFLFFNAIYNFTLIFSDPFLDSFMQDCVVIVKANMLQHHCHLHILGNNPIVVSGQPYCCMP